MSKKFVREAREHVKLFFEQYQIDPEFAKSHLNESLQGKRSRLKLTVHQLINNQNPEVNLDD